MARFLADENFNNQIVRGVLRQSSDIDIVLVQNVNLSGVDDPTVLEWAAQEERIVLTHDVATMTTSWRMNASKLDCVCLDYLR